jgi:hypothetical protein
MKFLEKIGLGRKHKPMEIRTVRQPGELRRRLQSAEEGGPPTVNNRKEPTMGSVFEDTGSLELEHNLAHEPAKNPYDTQSWEDDSRNDSRNDLRRIDAVEGVDREPKSVAARDNPYDRKGSRKGR